MKAKVLVDYTTPGGLTSIALGQVQALLEFTDDVEFLGPAPLNVEIPIAARFVPVAIPKAIKNPFAGLRALSELRRATKDAGSRDVIIGNGMRSALLLSMTRAKSSKIVVHHGEKSDSWLRRLALHWIVLRVQKAMTVSILRNQAWERTYQLSPNCTGDLRAHATDNERKKLRIGWFSRLDKPKKPDIWFQILRAAQYEGVVEGVVFGEGPLLKELRQMSSESDIDLTFGGFQDPKDGFAAMDISLFWSDSEGMPLAIQEAIWFGVPVITNRLPGIEAFLGASMVGLVDSPEEATDLIIKMQDPKFFAHVITQQQNRLKEVMKRPSMNDLIMNFVKEMQ